MHELALAAPVVVDEELLFDEPQPAAGNARTARSAAAATKRRGPHAATPVNCGITSLP